MFLSSSPRRILAYSDPVDMRKSFHGLVALVQGVLGEDPLSGSPHVFFNRRGIYVKLVTWGRTGYCLFAKQLEQGRFRLASGHTKQELSEQAFRLILDGIVLGRRRAMRQKTRMSLNEQAATMDREDIVALLASHQAITARVAELTRQLEWFKQQWFGAKSEWRFIDPDSRQLALGEWRPAESPG